MFEPKARWIEEGGSFRLMWGHIKVGEVSMGSNGTWYAYYNTGDHRIGFRSLKDFIAPDLAQREVECALERAADPS